MLAFPVWTLGLTTGRALAALVLLSALKFLPLLLRLHCCPVVLPHPPHPILAPSRSLLFFPSPSFPPIYLTP
jgi:hypothetical protein